MWHTSVLASDLRYQDEKALLKFRMGFSSKQNIQQTSEIGQAALLSLRSGRYGKERDRSCILSVLPSSVVKMWNLFL